MGFAVGLLLGELCGDNLAGAHYGHGHDGWLIWSGIFALSAVMGLILQKRTKGNDRLPPKTAWICLAVFAVGAVAIVLAVRAGIPTSFS